MKLSDCITDYLNFIRHERNLAKSTCLHYQCWLRHFTDWLDANGHPNADLDVFSVPVLRRYQYHKAKEGARPRTIHSAFHSLRGLGEFLTTNGLLDTNPCAGLTMPKKDAAQRLIVTDADVAALFEAAERQRTPRQVALSRAILCVLAYGGLRREEVCSLHISDVDLADKSILVRSGKGRKSRRVFVCTEAVHALREWLAQRETDCQGDWLFMYDRARRVYHTGIANQIETLKATAGLRDNEAIKPHGLRHWCLTNLMRNGANLKDVQQFAGHTDLQTTARYLHSSEEQLRSISELTALRPQPTSDKPALRIVDSNDRRDTQRRRQSLRRA
jgi:integrase/recombinase XerC